MSRLSALSVLLVEDDDVSREAVQRSFKKNEIDVPIVTAEDGMEALEILQSKHGSKRIQRPYIILLDLNMPRMNGFEFLDELRNDQHLSSDVVFVLSTSGDNSDRTRAYHRHIAGYMIKSEVGPQFRKVAMLIDKYQNSVVL